MGASAAGNILETIVQILTDGITGIAQGVGAGMQTLMTSIFLTNTAASGDPVYELSVFGAVIIIFAGIALAIGLCRWAMNFVTSLKA